jgi:hypothetical protein
MSRFYEENNASLEANLIFMTESILLNCGLLLMDNINTTKKTPEAVIGASKEACLEVSTEKAKHAQMPRRQTSEGNHNIVACFANARTVEARSLETGAQQKKNECL